MVRLVTLRLLESYFRHRWLYLLPLLALAAAGIMYIITLAPTYSTYGTLYIQDRVLLSALSGDTPGYSWVTPAQTTHNQLKELLKTDAFVRAAMRKTDLEAQMSLGDEAVTEAFKEFQTSVWVDIGGNNLVLFGAVNENPVLAQQIAKATVDTFILWNVNADLQEGAVARDFFADLLQPYQVDLDQARDQLRDYLTAHPAPIRGDRPVDEQMEINRLQDAVDQANKRIENTIAKEEEARLTLSRTESIANQKYTVIDQPRVPTESTIGIKSIASKLAIFLVAGVMLSILGIVGGVLLDRTFRLPIDVRHGLGLPLLGSVPRSRYAPAPPLADLPGVAAPESNEQVALPPVEAAPVMAAQSEDPFLAPRRRRGGRGARKPVTTS